jgi:formylglycine-generating enzyme required for sulfatase activity
LAPVGATSPHGDGKWSHADLSGNVSEWGFDSEVSPLPTPCVDCAVENGSNRAWFGGDYYASSGGLDTTALASGAPSLRSAMIGIRCAREP